MQTVNLKSSTSRVKLELFWHVFCILFNNLVFFLSVSFSVLVAMESWFYITVNLKPGVNLLLHILYFTSPFFNPFSKPAHWYFCFVAICFHSSFMYTVNKLLWQLKALSPVFFLLLFLLFRCHILHTQLVGTGFGFAQRWCWLGQNHRHKSTQTDAGSQSSYPLSVIIKYGVKDKVVYEWDFHLW